LDGLPDDKNGVFKCDELEFKGIWKDGTSVSGELKTNWYFYEGMVNNKFQPHGTGKIIIYNKSSGNNKLDKVGFDGIWVNGVAYYGKLVISDVGEYTGRLIDGIPNTLSDIALSGTELDEKNFESLDGKMIYCNGCSYTGGWLKGKFHTIENKGLLIYPDGRRYAVGFINGKKEGFGTYLDAAGHKYNIECKNDKIINKKLVYGKIFANDEINLKIPIPSIELKALDELNTVPELEEEILNDMFILETEEKFEEALEVKYYDNTIEKIIHIDKRNEKIIYYLNGNIFIGTLKASLPHGIGKMYYNHDKSIYHGHWKSGQRNGVGSIILQTHIKKLAKWNQDNLENICSEDEHCDHTQLTQAFFDQINYIRSGHVIVEFVDKASNEDSPKI
jgi:hypothetical protein